MNSKMYIESKQGFTSNGSLSILGEASKNTISSIVHWSKVASLALVITTLLLLTMERLIAMTHVEIVEEEFVPMPPVWMEEPVIKTIIDNKPKPPAEIDNVPPIPEPVVADGGKIGVEIPTTKIIRDKGDKFVLTSGANIPIAQYLVAAKYPASALRRGQEGYVDVMFDITAFGSTDNIRVLYAEPQGVFEQSATAAVSRWRYQPKMDGDKPVRFEGMTNRVRFEIQEGSL